MKLRDRHTSPPGGIYYITEDGKKIISPTDLRRLAMLVEDYLSANGMTVPEMLMDTIEDQICERLGPMYCWKGVGDKVADAIAGAARTVDKFLGTTLEKKAKSCSGCAKRRRRLNKLVN